MSGWRHVFGLAIAALPPLILFLAQTVLIARHETEAVSALAQYGGLFGLVFFVFDGQSGLAPAMLRLRHDDRLIRAAFRLYRIAVFLACMLAAVLLLVFGPPEIAPLAIALVLCLALRLKPMDHDLDRLGWQHWGMFAQNVWMIALAAAALVFGPLDAGHAAQAALWGNLPYALLHWRQMGTRPDGDTAWAAVRPVLLDLLALMSAQGLGQIYGRAVLFGLGALFAGPVAALVIYAKQAFNAAGILLLYLRRLELRANRGDMRLSLIGQAGIALMASIAVALAAARLGVPAALLILLIGWQAFEKISATAVYALQLSNGHDLAIKGLTIVMAAGAAGMAFAATSGTVVVFPLVEMLGYAAVLLLFGRTRFWVSEGMRS